MDQIRKRTRRKAPVDTRELIAEINPVIRGWGLYFCKAHIRKLFARLDRWILRRIWSHRFKRWRCRGWKQSSRTTPLQRDGSCAPGLSDTFT
jgi:RNA-directed DNA polymerase